MVLKHGVGGKTIKIAGGREVIKPPKMPTVREPVKTVREPVKEEETELEPKIEKKRERRRRTRRRGRDNGPEEAIEGDNPLMEESTEKFEGEEPSEDSNHQNLKSEAVAAPKAAPKAAPAKLFPAPTTLISDTIQRYRQDDHFKEVFYPSKGEGESGEHAIAPSEDRTASEGASVESATNLETHYALEPESLWDFIEEVNSSLEIEEANPSLKEEPK